MHRDRLILEFRTIFRCFKKNWREIEISFSLSLHSLLLQNLIIFGLEEDNSNNLVIPDFPNSGFQFFRFRLLYPLLSMNSCTDVIFLTRCDFLMLQCLWGPVVDFSILQHSTSKQHICSTSPEIASIQSYSVHSSLVPAWLLYLLSSHNHQWLTSSINLLVYSGYFTHHIRLPFLPHSYTTIHRALSTSITVSLTAHPMYTSYRCCSSKISSQVCTALRNGVSSSVCLTVWCKWIRCRYT